jgi:ADP-heptose:LPS heptosyltransferase
MLRRNILIFHTGGLGDFVLTWPFAVALARIYPQSRIIYLTQQQKGELARRVLRLESADIEAGWHGLFAEGGHLPPAATGLLQAARAVFSFLPVNPIWHQNVERINPVARRIGIDARIGPEFPGHLTDKILTELSEYPPEKSATQQILRSIADRGIGFKPAGGRDLVIHPGSGSPTKCWPIENFIELTQALKSLGRSVRFVIGEVEIDRWKNIDQLRSAAPVVICETCVQLLAEISSAAAVVGNDSGPAHLAGIIGIPTLALFGPTDPSQWRPLGPRVKTLRFQPIDGLSVQNVLREIAE